MRLWRLAFEFVPLAYELAKSFPSDERFELAAQLRRAATSVPLNIAEGAGRSTTPDFTRFLVIARGSLIELDTTLLLAERLGYINSTQTDEAPAAVDHIAALLNGLLKSLKH